MSNVIKEVVQIARRDYICDDCRNPITKRSKYNYLFGSAFKGEKPYSIRICQNCKPITPQFDHTTRQGGYHHGTERTKGRCI